MNNIFHMVHLFVVIKISYIKPLKILKNSKMALKKLKIGSLKYKSIKIKIVKNSTTNCDHKFKIYIYIDLIYLFFYIILYFL